MKQSKDVCRRGEQEIFAHRANLSPGALEHCCRFYNQRNTLRLPAIDGAQILASLCPIEPGQAFPPSHLTERQKAALKRVGSPAGNFRFNVRISKVHRRQGIHAAME